MLSLLPRIVARVAEAVRGLAGVHGVAGIGAELVAGKRLPAVFVAADGYRVLEVTGQLDAVRVGSRWLCCVAVRNVAEVRAGVAAGGDAADLVEAVLAALTGWQPAPGYQALRPIDAPRPIYVDGTLIYPIAFECGQLIRSTGSGPRTETN